MTPDPLSPLVDAIVCALDCRDADLWAETLRRHAAAEQAIAAMPPATRLLLAQRLDALLPGDWPLWVEVCASRDSSAADRVAVSRPQCGPLAPAGEGFPDAHPMHG